MQRRAFAIRLVGAPAWPVGRGRLKRAVSTAWAGCTRSLPDRQPGTFEPVVNRSTATALGLAIPLQPLACADEVMG